MCGFIAPSPIGSSTLQLYRLTLLLEFPNVPRWSGALKLRITGAALKSKMLCVVIFNKLVVVENSNRMAKDFRLTYDGNT